jgi:metacaspase-1
MTINIGLNSVDPNHYAGWDGALNACEADAKDMHALATSLGYEGELILTKDATADAVIDAISTAAEQLAPGDILFTSYSGHGGQVPDTNGADDEEDDRDETWALYDRQLVDDELYALWAKFQPGVRIFMLSDSCHSGTMARGWYEESLVGETVARGFGDSERPAVRSVPGDVDDQGSVRARTYGEHKELYDGIQKENPDGDDVDVGAHVILISGCEDNQQSLDGAKNGLFTGTLLKVWSGGAFKGGYRGLRRRILDRMPSTQSPNYFQVGPRNREFERQRPWTI